MKKSDLYRNYARVIDMCEGTDVKPAYCMKYIFNAIDTSIPYHNNGVVEFTCSKQQDPSKFIFALAIVEGKPVFERDVLYCTYKDCFKCMDSGTTKFSATSADDYKYATWNPPKPKTITDKPLPMEEVYKNQLKRISGQLNSLRAETESLLWPNSGMATDKDAKL